MKKCYRFYLIPSEKNEEIPDTVKLEDKYPLYAITDKKEYMKRFKKERNMKKFIYICSEVDDEEYADFANMYRSTVLSEKDIQTVFDKYGKNNKIDFVKILMTESEYQFSTEEEFIEIFSEQWWINYAPHPYIFNTKIQKALSAFQYDVCYKLYTGDSCGSDDYAGPAISIDNLAMFVFQYKELLK